jgi:hypothetical protein
MDIPLPAREKRTLPARGNDSAALLHGVAWRCEHHERRCERRARQQEQPPARVPFARWRDDEAANDDRADERRHRHRFRQAADEEDERNLREPPPRARLLSVADAQGRADGREQTRRRHDVGGTAREPEDGRLEIEMAQHVDRRRQREEHVQPTRAQAASRLRYCSLSTRIVSATTMIARTAKKILIQLYGCSPAIAPVTPLTTT